MNAWYICSDCGSDRLVYDREGDFVCTNCGLVKYGHVIDETAEWNNYSDRDDIRCEMYNECIPNKSKISALFNIEDDAMIITSTEIYNITIEKVHTKGEKHQAMIAAILYYAAKILKRGYSTSYIIESMKVKDADFWEFYKSLPLYWKNEKFYKDIVELDGKEQLITRMVHQLDTLDRFPTSQKQSVMISSKKVYLLCLKHNVCDSCKNSKLLGTIIYVACRMNNINSIRVQEIGLLYGIGVGTIQKQEAMIQTALLEEKKNVNK